MNHDYAYCSDYEANKNNCPEYCFRAQLTKDLKRLAKQKPIIASFTHFSGTDECPLKSFTVKINE